MGMDKNEIYKWIDLSGLPRHSSGRNKGTINWSKCAGLSVPFMYGEISGEIYIKEYIQKQRAFRVHVDGYTYGYGDTLQTKSLQYCSLNRILSRKIIDAAPELIPYLENPEDAYKYTPQSNKEVLTKCPFCGCKKRHRVADLYGYGFGCPNCSDGISYPNKFMYNILKQMGIKFKNEVTKRNKGFEWVGDYRYDFYFEIDGKRYITEMDGGFHDDVDVKATDEIKDYLAKSHGIEMIRIDCRYRSVNTRFDCVKNHILSSKLSKIFDFSNIDWNKANLAGMSSKIYEAAKLWDNGHGVMEIANILNVSANTIIDYLKAANNCNLCKYNKETADERKRLNCIAAIKYNSMKPLCLYHNNCLIAVLQSASELARRSFSICGEEMHVTSINKWCRQGKAHNGYTFQRITKEQYEQYKLQQTIPVY